MANTVETISRWLKDPLTNKPLAPKTLTSCVTNENGESVDTIVNDLQEQINNSQTQISNDPSNIITQKTDGIFAEEPFITVPIQTDASLDATAAVQTALTKALLTGKNLFFPKGIYTISERLVIPKSIKVFGASREDTVIKFIGTAKETTSYIP